MGSRTGLDAQIGFAAETVVGTAVTPTRFHEFLSESLEWTPTWLESGGLRMGSIFKRASRIVQSRKTVAGSISLEHATKGMGLLWAHALGSTGVPVVIGATTAYKQIHTPGSRYGKSLTVQVGRPDPTSGLTVPHTYSGCKISSWTFSVSDGEVAQFSIDVDGWDETLATALATASYPAGAGLFNFSQVTAFTTGGTASTASGETSVAGGDAVPGVVKKFEVKGDTSLDTERFGLGNAGVKSEQLENGISTITGSLDAEFDRATFYDVYKSGATTALHLTLAGGEIGTSGEDDTIDIILPAVKIKKATPSVSGPDVIQATVEFEAYDDETNPVIQVTLISSDSAL